MGKQGNIEDEVKNAFESTAIELIKIEKLTPIVIERDGVQENVIYKTGEAVLLTITNGKVTSAVRG